MTANRPRAFCAEQGAGTGRPATRSRSYGATHETIGGTR